MSSLIGTLFSGESGESADKLIAYNATTGAAGIAQAYFSASLAATTPEVRSFLSGYCTQCLTGHETAMNYMIQRNWTNPYDKPDTQLSRVVQGSISSSTSH